MLYCLQTSFCALQICSAFCMSSKGVVKVISLAKPDLVKLREKKPKYVQGTVASLFLFWFL